MPSLAHCIESYILAKDGNRPELLAQAFEPEAIVTLDVQTDQISFPGRLSGRKQISRELVEQFNRDYENVSTFCLATPPPSFLVFCCPWLVVMTDRHEGRLRLGWGLYDWRRESVSSALSELTITIRDVVIGSPESATPVLGWASALDYPWCPAGRLWDNAPSLSAMTAWRTQIDQAVVTTCEQHRPRLQPGTYQPD